MLPFNIASYALLAHIIGRMVNMVPGKIYGDLRNVHIYDNTIKQVKKQLSRDVNKYPDSDINSYIDFKLQVYNKDNDIDKLFNSFQIDNFKLPYYKSYPTIRAEMLSRD